VVADNTDCDDSDALVNRGQFGFFYAPSNGGTFDYNCSGTVEHETVRTTGCGWCNTIVGGFPPTCAFQSTCTSTTRQAHFSCGKTIISCSSGVVASFVSDTAAGAAGCNQNASYRTCGNCSAVGGTASSSTVARAMGCH
jgi:hypothetical protein